MHLRVLVMNLCDSGIADCYTGRSIAEAAAMIEAGAPDVVTLNEVCRSDVTALDRAFASVHPGQATVAAFQPAEDRRTGQAYLCRNGQPYGIGILVHLPSETAGYRLQHGIYPTQDLSDPEERAWLCVDAVGSFYACTTHLANTSVTVATAQCGYLLAHVVPEVRTGDGGYEPTILGGDLNLRGVQSCLPYRYRDTGDGGVQYVLATTDLHITTSRAIGMDGTTDHPALLVGLT
jgi:endonuclease/exonuclease/phosphatase family metal-dependent hydrolase